MSHRHLTGKLAEEVSIQRDVAEALATHKLMFFQKPTRLHCCRAFVEDIAPDHVDAILFGNLTHDHAVGFKAFLKQIRNQFSVHKINWRRILDVVNRPHQFG